MFPMIASPTRYMIWYNRWQNDMEEDRQKKISETGLYGPHCLGWFASLQTYEDDNSLTYWTFRSFVVKIENVIALCDHCRDYQYSGDGWNEPSYPECATSGPKCRYESQARHICKMMCLDPDDYSDLFEMPC